MAWLAEQGHLSQHGRRLGLMSTSGRVPHPECYPRTAAALEQASADPSFNFDLPVLTLSTEGSIIRLESQRSP